MKFSKIELHVYWSVKAALNIAFPKCKIEGIWLQMCDIIERLKPMVLWGQVTWIKPDANRVKINTDGSFLSENSKAGIGGTVKGSTGEFIMVFSVKTQCCSNNQAEALAAMYGVRWCTQNGFNRYDLEMDSLIIT